VAVADHLLTELPVLVPGDVLQQDAVHASVAVRLTAVELEALLEPADDVVGQRHLRVLLDLE
jgi:hypothetical protein